MGIRAAVGAPVLAGGRVWGAVAVGPSRPEPLPAGTEFRIGAFTDLVATAIANAEARTETGRLAEEQAALRRVATLVAKGTQPDEVFAAVAEEIGRIALKARATEAMTARPADPIRGELSLLADGLGTALRELQEISHGIHPAVLPEAGLGPALKALARRSAVPVEVDLNLGRGTTLHVRLPADPGTAATLPRDTP